MKKIYNFLLGSALVFCTGCSADLLDIDNPNEVTIPIFWNKAADAEAV